MRNAKGNGPDNKKAYMTYGIIAVGLVVGLVMKNLAIGLIIGLVGASIIDYVDKKNK